MAAAALQTRKGAGTVTNDTDTSGFPPVAQAVDIAPLAHPVAPPTEPIENLQYAGYGSLGIWREDKTLAFRKGHVIPAQRCIKCAEPSVGKPVKRKLSWHHPAIYAVLLISPVIYVIVALIVRKTAIVHVGLCRRHRNRQRMVVASTAILCLSMIPLSYAAFTIRNGELLSILGIFLLLIGLIVYVVAGQIVMPKQIDDHVVRMKGVGEPYLASFQNARA